MKEFNKDKQIESNINLNELSDLLKLIKENDIVEFQLERGSERLSLKRDLPRPSVHSGLVQTVAQMPIQASIIEGGINASQVASVDQNRTPASGSVSQVLPSVASKYMEIKSPMVGTFYKRPAVDAEPYVEIGSTVKKGDVLCIVEAMKLMNEIESDVSGRVVEICLEDAQMVEYGEVLFRIEPL